MTLKEYADEVVISAFEITNQLYDLFEQDKVYDEIKCLYSSYPRVSNEYSAIQTSLIKAFVNIRRIKEAAERLKVELNDMECVGRCSD